MLNGVKTTSQDRSMVCISVLKYLDCSMQLFDNTMLLPLIHSACGMI